MHPLLPNPEPAPDDSLPMDEELDEYQVRVLRRTLNLYELGFTTEQVLWLAPARIGFDWHEAEHLIRRGCSHELVVRILRE